MDIDVHALNPESMINSVVVRESMNRIVVEGRLLT